MKGNSILKLNEVRQRNMLSLLRVLLEKAPLSRVELARASGCDNTTVTRGIRELLKRGLVTTAGKQDVGHGRPREQLVIDREGCCLMGISLEPTGISGILTDLCGRPRMQERVRFSGSRSRKEYLEALEDLTRSLCSAAKGRLAGTGVSTFGTSLDPEGAVLHDAANFPELKDWDLRAFFQEKFRLSPCFADMMLCNMKDELHCHEEERRGITMLVHLGYGIGMSLAVDDAIYFQRNQHGGELGHNICNPDGELCRCGRRGCLETYCSVENFLRHFQRRKKLSEMPSLSQAALQYQKGDRACRAVVQELRHYLAIALANQINNLSPDHLVLAGPLLKLGGAFYDDLETELRSLLFEYTSHPLAIVFRDSGEENRTATGAALLARTRLLDSPAWFDALCLPCGS